MKRVVPVVWIMLGWVVLVAMGAAPESEVPVPEVEFTATVTDDQGISTKCTSSSWEGEVFFKAMRGNAFITIPFEKVKKAVFVAEAGQGKVDFQIMLKSGEVVAVTFDEDARFFGKTGFGTYRILAKNIREIVFE